MADAALSLASDSPLPQAGFDAQEREMSNVRSFDWVSDKIYPALTQFAAIAAVTAAGLFGWPYALVAGGGMLVFELARAHMRNQADLNRELVLYHNDIARVLGKSPNAVLTIQDMRNAADENVVGDKALKPLKLELDHLAFRSTYNFLVGATHAVITTGAALVLRGALSNIARDIDAGQWAAALSNPVNSLMMPVTGVLGAATGVTVTAEWLGKELFHRYEPQSVYPDLIALQDKARQEALKPEDVFSVTVKLDKDLADNIRHRLGKPYGELTYPNKERIIKMYEGQAHALALAKGINDGNLPVTAIALSAAKQMDWPNQTTASIAEESAAAINPTLPPPVIGISGANSDSASVRAMMTQIRDTGAVPLFLGNHAHRNAAADLAKIDALIVMGNNGDLNPARYGETVHPQTKIETDTAREQYEFALLAGAIDQKMPTLGVCGGMQRINVLLGGSLHQHVPDIVGNAVLHNQADVGIAPFCPVQAVIVEPDTQLATVAAGIRSTYQHLQKPSEDGSVPGGYVPENSMHHQSVNRLGKGLRASAHSEDGIIEAIEPAPGSPLANQFLLGVQWHPEFGASPLGPKIAQGLAGAAQEYAQEQRRSHPMHEAVEESLLSSMPAIAAKNPGLALQRNRA